MAAYYNENDRFAAAWLRELMKAGHIAPGDVDERSIEEVQPADLRGFTQCHFFAGIGIWSYALRAAGWPDDSPVWTGSCPCQSFSASGKRGGFTDKRHLWPAWFRLIGELRPGVVFGEQVASNDGLAWLDVVSADLEGAGYAVGAADLCAAGFGAPHIRQRLYFVADANRHRRSGNGGKEQSTRTVCGKFPDDDGSAGRVADAEDSDGWSGERGAEAGVGTDGERRRGLAGGGATGGLGDAEQSRLEGHSGDGREGSQSGWFGADEARPVAEAGGIGSELGNAERRGRRECGDAPRTGSRGHTDGPGLTNGFWRDAEWLWCRDGKWRPVEPGTFPLVAGTPNRVGRLRGYGNALCAPVTEAFIRAYREVTLAEAGD